MLPLPNTSTEISPTSYWYHFPKFVVSLLTAWFGAAATRENDYGFGWLPRNVGDHSHLPMFVAMSQGKIHGFMAMGQNPAVDGQNASLPRPALAKLDWLVVRDLYETETATFWIDSPEVKSGETKAEDIATEIFLLPAAATAEMYGAYTNTQRLIQWHDRTVDPPGDARSDLWFTVHLGLRLKRLYASSAFERDKPHQGSDLGLHRSRRERRMANQGRALRGARAQGDERVLRGYGQARQGVWRPQGRRPDALRSLDLQRRLRRDGRGARRS